MSASPRKVPVPRSAADYAPKVQDEDLRSQINAVLLQNNHVAKIHNHLSQSLAASPSDWPQKVSAHALNLMRSGEYTTFPKLMERVMEDVKRDTENARKVVEERKRAHGKTDAAAGRDGAFELALPRKVEEEGIRITRECLELVCEMTE